MMNEQSTSNRAKPSPQLPPPLLSMASRLAEQGVREGDLVFCASTDIDLLGRYDPQWLAVTPGRVLVTSDDSQQGVSVDLALGTPRNLARKAAWARGYYRLASMGLMSMCFATAIAAPTNSSGLRTG